MANQIVDSPATSPSGALERRDSGLLSLLLLGKFFGKPADEAQLRHQFGTSGVPLSEGDLLRASREIGFKAQVVESSWERLASTPLPCIAGRKDGSFLILAKAAEGQMLVQDPLVGRPQTFDRAAFEAFWNNRLLLLTSRSRLVGPLRKFDISWFIPAVVRYRRIFIEVLGASLFLQLFGLISPMFFMVIIDKVLIHRGLSSLDVLIFALITVSVFEVLLGGLRTYIFSHTTNRVDVELGTNLFKHLLNLPIAYFGVRRVGETVARVRELENIRNFITGSALTLVVDLAFTVIFFIAMFNIVPTLAWIVVASLPLYVVLTGVITPTLRQRVEERFKRGSENQAFLVESVTGIETLKSMAVEPQMQRRWDEQMAAYVSASFRASTLGNIGSQGVQFIQKTTMALTLWFGARTVMDGDMTVGQLVAFNMLSGRVSQPILRLAQLWQDFQQMRVSIDRLGDILNNQPEKPPTAATLLPQIRGEVEFDKVSFRYTPGGPEILHQIGLRIPAGQVVGIVGPSGSGKSTLTKLIQRLYLAVFLR
jgi:subfamily B ATP-binding cassette protein HlyB/CyaB